MNNQHYTEWAKHRSCERKHAYDSKLLADNWATYYQWTGAPPLTTYQCDYGDHYHICKTDNYRENT